MTRRELRAGARAVLRAGLKAVEPGRLVRAHLESLRHKPEVRRILMVAVGKAAVPMARAAHRTLGRRIERAIVIAPDPSKALPRTESFVAGHPIPDGRGIRAGRAVIRLLEGAKRGDLVLLLLSGGASALMPAPVPGVSLGDKQRVTEALMRRGATIKEMNAVRKGLSRLKGGGFASLAAPARVMTLALSDVPGDEKGTIGSGPTVSVRGGGERARRILDKFFRRGEIPPKVLRAILRNDPKPSRGARARTLVIGSGGTFAEAAARKARSLGFRVRILRNALRGEARLCGPRLVRRFAVWRRGPSCLIATGETVVTVRGNGRGGRNQEMALAASETLARQPLKTVFAAFATDGCDGPDRGASGGLVDEMTARKARPLGVSVKAALADNDSTAALHRLGGLLKSRPTGTNVSDVTVIMG